MKTITIDYVLTAAPAAPQPSQQVEPVVEFIEDAKAVGGARFKFLRPLRVGTKLYTAPPSEDARDAARYRACCADTKLFIDAAFAETKDLTGKEVIDAAIDATMRKGGA